MDLAELLAAVHFVVDYSLVVPVEVVLELEAL